MNLSKQFAVKVIFNSVYSLPLKSPPPFFLPPWVVHSLSPSFSHSLLLSLSFSLFISLSPSFSLSLSHSYYLCLQTIFHLDFLYIRNKNFGQQLNIKYFEIYSNLFTSFIYNIRLFWKWIYNFYFKLYVQSLDSIFINSFLTNFIIGKYTYISIQMPRSIIFNGHISKHTHHLINLLPIKTVKVFSSKSVYLKKTTFLLHNRPVQIQLAQQFNPRKESLTKINNRSCNSRFLELRRF